MIFLFCLGALVLVWWGFAYAERRFRYGWKLGSVNTRVVVANAHPALLSGDEIKRQALEELIRYEPKSACAMLQEEDPK